MNRLTTALGAAGRSPTGPRGSCAYGPAAFPSAVPAFPPGAASILLFEQAASPSFKGQSKTGVWLPRVQQGINSRHEGHKAKPPASLFSWEYPCCGLGAVRILAAWERGGRGPVMPDRFV